MKNDRIFRRTLGFGVWAFYVVTGKFINVVKYKIQIRKCKNDKRRNIIKSKRLCMRSA